MASSSKLSSTFWTVSQPTLPAVTKPPIQRKRSHKRLRRMSKLRPSIRHHMRTPTFSRWRTLHPPSFWKSGKFVKESSASNKILCRSSSASTAMPEALPTSKSTSQTMTLSSLARPPTPRQVPKMAPTLSQRSPKTSLSLSRRMLKNYPRSWVVSSPPSLKILKAGSWSSLCIKTSFATRRSSSSRSSARPLTIRPWCWRSSMISTLKSFQKRRFSTL